MSARTPSEWARPASRLAAVVALGFAAVPAVASSGEGARAARADSPDIALVLCAAAEVGRAEVSLRDLVEVMTDDRTVRARLEPLALGRAPRLGETARLDRASLARWISVRTGVAAGRILWSGAERCLVRRAAQAFPGNVIVSHAEQALRTAVEKEGLRVELDVAGTPWAVELPAGRVDVIVRPIPADTALRRRATVWVDLKVDGAFVSAAPVTFGVSAFGPAYVSTAAQRAGQLLVASTLEVRELEWSGRAARPVAVGSLPALRLRRALAAGEALTAAHVEPAPLLARGDWATLHAGKGPVALERRVEVLQDGSPGQTVRVKAPGGAAVILARVTGPGVVEVLE